MDSSKVQFGDFQFVEFINEAAIHKRVNEMAREIENSYPGDKPIFIIVLNGAFVFAADLLRAIQFDCRSTFVKLKSYQGFASTGKVENLLDLELDIQNQDVIIIEDIIDTGNTLNVFLQQLEKKNPKSVRLASLLHKPDSFQYAYPIDFVGFDIPDKFVIGYGLDYNDQGRNLSAIYQKLD